MVIFKFREIGEALGTRQLGAQARERLLPLIESNDKVVLDFEGVSVVSNSFADECLAKLLLVMPFEELKRRTTFASVNDLPTMSLSRHRYPSIAPDGAVILNDYEKFISKVYHTIMAR